MGNEAQRTHATRLFIAEKPSLGRAIAAALPGPLRKRDGYIEASSGDIVTWCFGHLLEQVEPHAYEAKYKRWDLADLPIMPSQWHLAARKDAKKQLATIVKLLKSATNVVHAGDPDREGQLLVDEVLGHCGLSEAQRNRAGRLLINDLNLEAVKKALASMRSNAEFQALSSSALARSRADWLYGINMTRAFTLLAQRKGHQGVLSVGRVQTPVLGLVARRDTEIANFVSKPFYQVIACIPHEGSDIRATWQPSEACARFQDSEGRVVHKPLADNVAGRIKGQSAQLLTVEHKQSKQAAPLPFSLSALQIEAAKQFGLSAAAVLTSAQALYEKHKAITYPRSDCRYLPSEHHKEASAIVQVIVANAPTLQEHTTQLDTQRQSKAWNDTKVGAHHAIIPTPHNVGQGALSKNEAKLYELIARQYLMQFAEPALFANACLEFEIGGGKFVAKGQTLLEDGWKTLQPTKKSKKTKKPDYLPRIKVGTALKCRRGQVVTKKTEAPKAFTDATLLQAMTGIGRFVADTKLRKILKETDGLGTEATRASILEGLFRRKLLARKGKSIYATATGQSLVRALPKAATTPDMTAEWEQRLRGIANKTDAYGPFMASLGGRLREMLGSAIHPSTSATTNNSKAPSSSKNEDERTS